MSRGLRIGDLRYTKMIRRMAQTGSTISSCRAQRMKSFIKQSLARWSLRTLCAGWRADEGEQSARRPSSNSPETPTHASPKGIGC